MIFWLLVGVVLGYFFKPQLDKLVGKAIRKLRENREKNRWRDPDDDY
ncbi:MAG: hypothetical protein AB1798_02760 [Spirochaetota bacterium]